MAGSENSQNSSEWFGAIFFYLFFLGKREFKTLYQPKYNLRNIIAGYVIKLILLAIAIALFIYYFL